MRWIFLTLVFGNLLLLAVFWQQQNKTEIAPVVALDIPGNTRQLQLVRELQEPLPEVVEERVANEERAPLCYVAGPFADELDARHLLARAEALSLTGLISSVEIAGNEPAEYWVYVPPRASREEALRVLRELQQRSYDSYIITQGDMAEGVSLGLFRNKESAYELQKTVERFDIPVEVRVVTKATWEYWVEIREVAQLNEQMRERVKAGDSRVSWELVECKTPQVP